ncbi:MAG: flagellar motor protein PomA [Gammaproteobacteria bacterium]|nr:MAG: flagellar motor protein PomA [Gammaproteobacteria bacterium]
MDLATLIGLVGAIGIVLAAIFTGGSALVFINVPSILIVLGGTVMVVMMKFTLQQFLGAFGVAARAFTFKLEHPEELIEEVVNLSNVSRKEGMLALESIDVNSETLKMGIQMLVDGNEQEVIRSVMTKDMQQTIDRHSWGAKVFSSTGDVAPAMGMIGTLIGLVQMLSSMDDPKSIGPAMAVALLTTLYGAMLANMVALPIADKLNLRKAEEGRIKAMCIDAVIAIQEGQNPRIIESMLQTYLDPKKRKDAGK